MNSESGEQIRVPVADSELAIDINSTQTCENSDVDDGKSSLPNEYSWQQEAQRLIEVSKQLQKNYEKEFGNSDGLQLKIEEEHTGSNSMLSELPTDFETKKKGPHYNTDIARFNNLLTKPRKENVGTASKIPKIGPYGTGIIRPSPKKHSCVQNAQPTSIKRKSSYRSGRDILPYSTKYYNFNRAHPNLKLIESEKTVFPKRVLKTTSPIDDDKRRVTSKPFGITWHELFNGCAAAPAKSLQQVSSCDTAAQSKFTQTSVSESAPSTPSTTIKCQKHVLPQLNIRAECTVQKIPELSIAPDDLKRSKPNIKLIEIVYGESESLSKVKQPTVTTNEHISPIPEQAVNKEKQNSARNSSPLPIDLENTQSKINEKINNDETQQLSPTTSSTSPSCESESFSENDSRISAVTHNETEKAQLHHAAKVKRFVKLRSTTQGKSAESSSELSEFEPQEGCESNATLKVQMPMLSTKQLMQMVDDIFDTTSDGCDEQKHINIAHNVNGNTNPLQMVKETSVQTDIVWEHVSDYLRQQSRAIEEQMPRNMGDIFQFNDVLNQDCRGAKSNTNETRGPPTECDSALHREPLHETPHNCCCPNCIKKLKCCSCLGCQKKINFSVINIRRPVQDMISSDSSSFVVPSIHEQLNNQPPIRRNLLPSERYKEMKLAQRRHFESDPRIAKTLNSTQQSAKMLKSPLTTTTSSSSQSRKQMSEPLQVSDCYIFSQDESLQPDLYTFDDELLLFGTCSTDEYDSSRLLKTESSEFTSTSNERCCGQSGKSYDRKKYFCTNSEDSCHLDYPRSVSDLEKCLLKDLENSWSDPTMLNSELSTSSLERKINEIQMDETRSKSCDHKKS